MSTQTIPFPRFSDRTKPEVDPSPERVDRLHLPEQATGPVPQRTERPAAEILAERQRESDPAGAAQSFVP